MSESVVDLHNIATICTNLTRQSTYLVDDHDEEGLGVSVLPVSAVLDDMPIIRERLPDLPNTSVMSFVPQEASNPYAERFIDFLLAGVEDGVEDSVVFLNREGEGGTRRQSVSG